MKMIKENILNNELIKINFDEEAKSLALKARSSFKIARCLTLNMRNTILLETAKLLLDKNKQNIILENNKKDLENAEKNNVSINLLERLTLNEKRIAEMAQALNDIAKLQDPLGEVIFGKKLPNGIELTKSRVPIGVVLTIYESRPNVTTDVAALCIKSGNVVILRGGKESFLTNKALYDIFLEVFDKYNIPKEIINFVSNTDKELLKSILKQKESIDLVVPRGGTALIDFITENTKIPIVKHDSGLCNIYIDKSANFEKARNITINSKLQRPAVCNAIENLIIHRDYPDKKKLLDSLFLSGIKLYGDDEVLSICPNTMKLVKEILEESYLTEFLDERLSVKIVGSIKEAIQFIDTHTSRHSEAIVSEDYNSIIYFKQEVDTAGIFINCSTRFHDGGQFGFGAEVGISTGRMHVRGPMTLQDLTTTSYTLLGNGQIRN